MKVQVSEIHTWNMSTHAHARIHTHAHLTNLNFKKGTGLSFKIALKTKQAVTENPKHIGITSNTRLTLQNVTDLGN